MRYNELEKLFTHVWGESGRYNGCLAMKEENLVHYKKCSCCGIDHPLSEYRRRTGRKSGPGARRGMCRECRRQSAGQSAAPISAAGSLANAAVLPLLDKPLEEQAPALDSKPARPTRSQKRRAARKRAKARREAAVRTSSVSASPAPGDEAAPHPARTGPARNGAMLHRPAHPPRYPVSRDQPDPYDASRLVPTRMGTIRMRGKTDKGRRWQQDIDPALAVLLVQESAAVVVNRHTIRRLFTNKGFRRYVLERDGYSCYFCGSYGDTIDHLLPRAKGGHTTPVNCVCACIDCNQSKADKDLEEFISLLEPQ